VDGDRRVGQVVPYLPFVFSNGCRYLACGASRGDLAAVCAGSRSRMSAQWPQPLLLHLRHPKIADRVAGSIAPHFDASEVTVVHKVMHSACDTQRGQLPAVSAGQPSLSR
jgi:hypothetical protein